MLGGGGGPGIAFLCGALRAFDEVAGLRVRDADLVIGTSAGAVVSSRALLGQTFDEISAPAPRPEGCFRDTVLVPRWHSRGELARTALGAGLALWHSASRLPVPGPVLRSVQRTFPPGLFDVGAWSAARLDRWPDQRLWLVTADLRSGRRVVLHRPERSDQQATLQQAVAASCAVPGMFMPMPVGDHALVDGGVRSSTNLDLAARARSRVVFCLAPMAYDPSRPIPRRLAASRAVTNQQIARERRRVERAGGRVLVVRPTGADLAARGRVGLFSDAGAEAIAERAYATTREVLLAPLGAELVRQAHQLLGTVADPRVAVG